MRPSYVGWVFFVSILHFYAYVTILYRLVGAVVNLPQANSRFQRSWHVSTQKSNTNLDYFTFNQSIKLKFSLYRAIWVCFTWIAHCTPHPLPTTTYSHPSPPKLHPRKREWRVSSNRILVFTQRFLGSSRGKHCNSLERFMWKVVLTSKKTILERNYCFLSVMDLGDVGKRKA